MTSLKRRSQTLPDCSARARGNSAAESAVNVSLHGERLPPWWTSPSMVNLSLSLHGEPLPLPPRWTSPSPSTVNVSLHGEPLPLVNLSLSLHGEPLPLPPWWTSPSMVMVNISCMVKKQPSMLNPNLVL